jgi:hypothetical protein
VIEKYIKENSFTFPIGLATKESGGSYDVAEQWGVMAYPTNFVLAPDGKVLWRGTGFNERAIRAALEMAGVK